MNEKLALLFPVYTRTRLDFVLDNDGTGRRLHPTCKAAQLCGTLFDLLLEAGVMDITNYEDPCNLHRRLEDGETRGWKQGVHITVDPLDFDIGEHMVQLYMPTEQLFTVLLAPDLLRRVGGRDRMKHWLHVALSHVAAPAPGNLYASCRSE